MIWAVPHLPARQVEPCLQKNMLTDILAGPKSYVDRDLWREQDVRRAYL